MADIKSTLDLVMERTRHLSMSDADRHEQAAAELRAHVNRLTQRFLDGTIDSGRFHDEIGRLDDAPSLSVRNTAAAEVGKRIEPDRDNGPLLELLKHGVGVDASTIETVLDEYRLRLETEEREVTEQITSNLRARGISGSAVVPNPGVHRPWAGRREEITEQARRELSEAFSRLAE